MLTIKIIIIKQKNKPINQYQPDECSQLQTSIHSALNHDLNQLHLETLNNSNF